MVINLSPQLSSALNEQAQRRGVAPESLAEESLRELFLPDRTTVAEPRTVEPRDEWERQLFGAAIDCGVSVSDTALSSEGLYD